jgi:hypothetical protein
VIIRDQLRSQIRGTALRRFYEDALGKQEKPGYFLGALLAGTIAPAMLDQFVDGFVTSEGLVDLLGKDPDHKERNGITISRTGFTDLDEYTIQLSKGAADPAKTITAVLRRQGTIWRVVRVEFPPGKAPWEASEPPWTGLKIEKLVPSRTPEGLVIDGDIVNNGGMTQDLPRLRVALRDASEKEVQFKIVDPPQPRLAPGAVAHFKTPFDHPDDAAKGVVVTFAHIPSSDNKTLASGRTDDPAPARSAAASKPDQRNSISKSEAPQQSRNPSAAPRRTPNPKRPRNRRLRWGVVGSPKANSIWSDTRSRAVGTCRQRLAMQRGSLSR